MSNTQTPAQAQGFVEGETIVSVVNMKGEWKFTLDDKSSCPLFQRMSDGVEHYFRLSEVVIKPPAPRVLFQDAPIPAVSETPTPAPVPAEITEPEKVVTPMTVWQSRAHECFKSMYDDAVLYRSGGISQINTVYGICDNIGNYTEFDSQMARVKDNLIRQTPSFSGEHHYPVKSDDVNRSAEWAWDYRSNKWSDGYGLNRLNQLGELITMIEQNWHDELIEALTPARAAGFKVDDQVWNKEVKEVWTFIRDDGSNDPYFRRPDGRDTSYHLRHIKKLETVLSGLPFNEIIESMKGLENEKALLQEQAAAITAQLGLLEIRFAQYDAELAHTYGVQRIKK